MTTSELTVRILKQGREIISDKQRWCIGALARNAGGKHVPTTSEDAVSFCALGAGHRAAMLLGHRRARAWRSLLEATCQEMYDGHDVPTVNDNWRTPGEDKYQEVLAMYDRAIERAEAALPREECDVAL